MDHAYTELVFELLKQDLSAPRVLLEQVVNYINDRYGFPPSELKSFFAEKFPTLEEYEVDLAFSPQYTPAEHHRLAYIPALGANALTVSELGQLKARLLECGLQTAFTTADCDEPVSVQVHEVFIERFVNLLKLDQPVAEGIYTEILKTVPQASHNEVNLQARDSVWQNGQKAFILKAFLRTFHANNNFSTLKVSFLTNFVRTYRPASLLEMEALLSSLIKSCQVDMENVAGRGFHDEYLKALNTGNSLTKGTERDVWQHYHHMMDLATQLKEDLLSMPTVVSEVWAEAQSVPV
ncbi:hypothetical protein [Vampirovibrio chlorellavorus]|uniref:hypothetical protein n=1 Tax=Vampirovibrio chlorellavorus TaxID=758823 RepID=UPI0026F1DB03|nr:hypothetical protein [Vampirovibrio chlorellavorus]